jgi:hypothetical protein
MGSRLRKWFLTSQEKWAELTASRKGQYEKRFKDWSFQKKRTKEDWQVIGWKVDKRKRAGKESNVYVGGTLMPAKRLRKEISRQGYMSVMDQLKWAQGWYIQAPKLAS